MEKVDTTNEVVKKRGLGIITAAIFLAGEMAGSGVLALPAAMVGTGQTKSLTKIQYYSQNKKELCPGAVQLSSVSRPNDHS